MSEEIISFQRRFQVWLYLVGHGQLLLRSNRSEKFSTRIDVLFKNIAAMELPTVFDGLSVAEAATNELHDLNIQLGALPIQNRRYLLSGGPTLGATSLQVLSFGTRMKVIILTRVILSSR